MSDKKAASWTYIEQLVTESAIITQARSEANELGITPISPATGKFIAGITSLPHIKAIAEIGTGTGVSGMYLLAGNEKSTLTTIDTDAEAQSYTREHFSAMGIRTARCRFMHGYSADLLPRLAAEAYDLVLLDGDPLEASEDTEEAIRILRPGGILLVAHALNDDKVSNPTRRDEATVALRNLGLELLESTVLKSTLVPIGDGLIFAVKK